METVSNKIQVLLNTLIRLEDGIEFFRECEKKHGINSLQTKEEIFFSSRDSMIHRFKCCVDLFWKVFKMYLDNQNINISIVSPKEIVCVSMEFCFLSEDEGAKCISMLAIRSKIPDMYQRVVADEIAHKIPIFYPLMQKVAERMQQGVRE